MLVNKKAQTGIGTLILFLAMIIVASIAANVLVQTATSLQNQALKTGKAAEKGISTMAQAIGIIGINGTDNTVEEFRIEMKLMPGSSGIDLSKASISVETQDGNVDLLYSPNACENSSVTGYATDGTNHNGTFTVKYLVSGVNQQDGYLQRGDIAQFCFAHEESIGEDREVSIRFVPSVGMPTIVSFVTKDVMTSYNVKLYP